MRFISLEDLYDPSKPHGVVNNGQVSMTDYVSTWAPFPAEQLGVTPIPTAGLIVRAFLPSPVLAIRISGVKVGDPDPMASLVGESCEVTMSGNLRIIVKDKNGTEVMRATTAFSSNQSATLRTFVDHVGTIAVNRYYTSASYSWDGRRGVSEYPAVNSVSITGDYLTALASWAHAPTWTSVTAQDYSRIARQNALTYINEDGSSTIYGTTRNMPIYYSSPAGAPATTWYWADSGLGNQGFVQVVSAPLKFAVPLGGTILAEFYDTSVSLDRDDILRFGSVDSQTTAMNSWGLSGKFTLTSSAYTLTAPFGLFSFTTSAAPSAAFSITNAVSVPSIGLKLPDTTMMLDGGTSSQYTEPSLQPVPGGSSIVFYHWYVITPAGAVLRASGKNATIELEEDGLYQVYLVVTDNEGAMAYAKKTVTVDVPRGQVDAVVMPNNVLITAGEGVSESGKYVEVASYKSGQASRQVLYTRQKAECPSLSLRNGNLTLMVRNVETDQFETFESQNGGRYWQ